MSDRRRPDEIRNRIQNLWKNTDFSQAIFRSLAGYAIIAADFDGNILAYNRGAEEIYGYKSKEVIGKQNVEALFPREFVASGQFGEVIKHLVEQGTYSYEGVKVRADGSQFPAQILLTLTKDEQAQVVGFIEIVQDLTERKRAEAELEKYRKHLEDLVQQRTAALTTEIAVRRHAEEELEQKRRQLIEQNRITSDFLGVLETTATSLNFNESLHKLLPYINDLVGSDACLVYQAGEQRTALEPLRQYGLSEQNLSYFMSSSLPLSGGTIAVTAGARAENDFVASRDVIATSFPELDGLLDKFGAQSVVMMPLVYEAHTRLVLMGIYLETKLFGRTEKDIADRLRRHLEASYIAYRDRLALLDETMRLAHHLQMIEAMSSIDRSILASTTSQEVIGGAIKLFPSVVATDIIEILEFSAEQNAFRHAATFRDNETLFDLKESFDIKNTHSWHHVMFGAPAYYPDLATEDISGDYESRFLRDGYKALLVLPLMSKGELLGMLSIANRRVASFSPNQLSVVERLANQIAVALSNTSLLRQLQDLIVGIVNSLVAALDAKSPWTTGHSQRVADVAVRIGESLGLNESRLYDLRLAALFHDVGKIGTYDAVLDKAGKLTDEERDLVARHPQKAYDILAPIPRLKHIAEIAMSHHERWDGGGYPRRLTGDDIPYLARIISLADTFDAMTSDRPYRKGLEEQEAAAEISGLAGKQFDPDMTAVFTTILRDRTARKARGRRRARRHRDADQAA